MGFSQIGENRMKHKLYSFRRGVMVVALVAMAGFCHSCDKGSEVVSLKAETAQEPPSESENAALALSDGDEEQMLAVCYVHICGAVAHPGVYEMQEGQRIYQAVELAGGYTQEAASDYLNLAETVADGMKLVVPARDELLSESEGNLYGTAAKSSETEPVRVNLNTATKEQLMELSGIGEARAGDIIRYRETHGGFQAIEDIMKVPGIKDAAFQKIKDQVTV